jgi:tetratricopeptide (TPR) repeat protein
MKIAPATNKIYRGWVLKTVAGLTAVAMVSFLSVGHLCAATHGYRYQYDTIAHDFFDMESGFGVTIEDYQRFDHIINEVKRRIKLKPRYAVREGVLILRTIDSILKERNFHYGKNRFLNHGMKSKSIDCEIRAAMYLGIAEALKLPLKGVLAPDHVFVRWDPDGKHDAVNPSHPVNKGDFNWETTKAGIWSDNDYRAWREISEKSIVSGVYLKNLNRNELFSIWYLNRGIAWREKGYVGKAIRDHNRAIQLNPKYPSAYNNRAINLWRTGDLDKSIEDLNETIRLDPNYSLAIQNRRFAVWQKSEFDKAVENHGQAIRPGRKKYVAMGSL